MTSIDLKKRFERYIKDYPDKAFKNFVGGKTVAVVGPAEYLQNTVFGSVIDGYELVIRHNNVLLQYPFDSNNAKSFGSRLDILYMAPPRMQDAGMLEKIKRANFRCFRGRGTVSHTQKRFVEAETLLKRRNVSVSRADHTRLLLHTQELHISPSSGLLSIVDCLLAGSKCILVTGFSFYHGGGHLFRKGGELVPKLGHHDLTKEIKLLYSLKDAFPDKLITDQYLDDLYARNYKNVTC